MRLFVRNRIGTDEALTMLDGLVNERPIKERKKETLSLSCLSNLKDKLEKIRVLNKKQSHINDYFMLE